ncbi:MAG: DUF4340 domain-containing protein [Myxococcales bacterium]|nr:DUF4340 domain-containing protein [Myxococcales bacterium]
MRQTTRTLWMLAALALLAAGLGLYAYYGVEKGDQREQERKEVTDLLFSLRREGEKAADGSALQLEFTSITVSAKGETTVLEREGGEWRITSPIRAKADKVTVDSLTSQIQTAKLNAKVEENPDQAALAKYGLEPPAFTVSAYAYVPDEKGGGKDDPSRRREATVHGGIENTFDGSVYLKKEGDPAVYSAAGGVRWSLEKTTYELRDKEVMSVDEAKLKSIEVRAKANSYALERDEKKAWKMIRPVAIEVDASAVTTMLSSIRYDRATAFPKDTPEERAALGLEAPQSDVTFTLESGEKVRLRLARRALDAGEKAHALREESSGATLAEVSPVAVSALDKSPADLKDKSLLAFDKEQVARIAFKLASGQEVLVERSPTDAGWSEDWQVVAPERGPAKKWKLSSLLWSLASLKAAQLGEVPKDWSKYGVDAKSRSVALFGRDGQELSRLWLGKEVDGKPGTLYARGVKPELGEVDSGRLSELPSALTDVLDRPAPTDAGPPSP